MRTASLASRTNGSFSSASEYTATVDTPRLRAAAPIRRAISPRFAIRIFRNIAAAERTRKKTECEVKPRRHHARVRHWRIGLHRAAADPRAQGEGRDDPGAGALPCGDAGGGGGGGRAGA